MHNLHMHPIIKRNLKIDFFTLQWCAIEMERLLHKPYVNEVTLNGQNLYSNFWQTSKLKLCVLRRLRSFQRGTVDLCRSTGSKVTSCQSWRMILSSGNRTRAAHLWFEVGRKAEFFSNLQLWQLVILTPLDQQRPTVPLWKDLNLFNKLMFNY